MGEYLDTFLVYKSQFHKVYKPTKEGYNEGLTI